MLRKEPCRQNAKMFVTSMDIFCSLPFKFSQNNYVLIAFVTLQLFLIYLLACLNVHPEALLAVEIKLLVRVLPYFMCGFTQEFVILRFPTLK